MLTPELESVKLDIEDLARQQGVDFIVTEHLLYGLLLDDAVHALFVELDVDCAQLKQRLLSYFAEHLGIKSPTTITPKYSMACEWIFRRAVLYAKTIGGEPIVGCIDVLEALMADSDSYAVQLLMEFGLTRLKLRRYLSHKDKEKLMDESGFLSDDSKDGDEPKDVPLNSVTARVFVFGTKMEQDEDESKEDDFLPHVRMHSPQGLRLEDFITEKFDELRNIGRPKRAKQDSHKNTSNKQKKSALTTYAHNLNEKAKQGKTDPLIGREREIERVAQILCRRRKNNPLLVGDAGVGKTAIAEGLAWLIVNDKVAPALKNATVYSLDVGALIAGTKYRGDFESRMKDLLDALKKQPDVILFIDEIHTIVGAGSSMDGNMDVSNLIKPALANGELRCIGSTTFEEFRQIFEKDHALSRRFQKLDIKEPSIEDSIGILHGLKSHYENFHQVQYTDDALRTAVELSVKHINDRFLPDKAIDVIDEAGARVSLTYEGKEQQEQGVIDVADIEAVIASIARIPAKSVSSDDLAVLGTLKDDLNAMVFGQDEAIDKLSDAIILSRAGLKSMVKPIGSFMFAGPTGVGKTEIARQLALTLGIPLIRFDMSEYMEAHSVSRLIGSPPGYVGHDKGGLLTEKIHQTPHAVLLLDELEKAHSDIYNILLQVMDHGKLTDNNGREVSFRQVILIMTTNVGADSISRNSMGFTKQNHTTDNTEAMKRAFSPEFRNRLDAIVQFSPLNDEAVAQVVDKFLSQAQALLDDKNVKLMVSDTARAYLAKKGYDPMMGARPMARLIDDELKKPLAHEILFGKLKQGGQVHIDERDGALVFDIQENTPESALA